MASCDEGVRYWIHPNPRDGSYEESVGNWEDTNTGTWFVHLIASRKGCAWPKSRIKRVGKTRGRFFSSNFPLRSYSSWNLRCLIPCILSSSVVIASLNKPDSHNKKKKKNKDEKSKSQRWRSPKHKEILCLPIILSCLLISPEKCRPERISSARFHSSSWWGSHGELMHFVFHPPLSLFFLPSCGGKSDGGWNNSLPRTR